MLLGHHSAANQIATLSGSDAFVKNTFVPIHEANRDRLNLERRRLSQWLGPAISRATEKSGQKYTIQTTTGMTDIGVVISAVVTRVPAK